MPLRTKNQREVNTHLPGFLLFNFIPHKIPALMMDGTTHIQDGLFTLTDTSRLFLADYRASQVEIEVYSLSAK